MYWVNLGYIFFLFWVRCDVCGGIVFSMVMIFMYIVVWSEVFLFLVRLFSKFICREWWILSWCLLFFFCFLMSCWRFRFCCIERYFFLLFMNWRDDKLCFVEYLRSVFGILWGLRNVKICRKWWDCLLILDKVRLKMIDNVLL